MNILLVLIIIGLCVMNFGFWTTVAGFFVAILWIITIIFIIIGVAVAFSVILDALR